LPRIICSTASMNPNMFLTSEALVRIAKRTHHVPQRA
jgi:hypothetical protein